MRSVQRTSWWTSARDVLPLAAATAVVGLSFGAVATAAGFPATLVAAMSVLVFAGGAQFLVLGVLTGGGGVLAAVTAGLLLNARHLPLGLAMAGVMGGSRATTLLGAHLLTDETVAFTRDRVLRDGQGGARRAYWTSGILLLVAWNVGSLVGSVVGGLVEDPSALGVDAAFPAGLLALLLPGLLRRDAVDVRLVAAAGAVVAVATTPVLPAGLPVLAAVLVVLLVRPGDRGASEVRP